MKYLELKDFIQKFIDDPKIKSIKIKDWKDMGEFSGDKPLPIIKIKKYKV